MPVIEHDAAVNIARCPEHGLHGERTECFVCGGPVEQVEMVPAATHREAVSFERRSHDWIAFLPGDRTRWEAADSPEEALSKLRIAHPAHFEGQPATLPGDWYAIRFQLATGYAHEDAFDVFARVETHPAVGSASRWSIGAAGAVDEAYARGVTAAMNVIRAHDFPLTERVDAIAEKLAPTIADGQPTSERLLGLVDTLHHQGRTAEYIVGAVIGYARAAAIPVPDPAIERSDG